MIEFFYLITQFFIFYFLMSFSFLKITNVKSLQTLSFSENISLNIIIFLNFILIVSFLNLKLDTIIISYLICYFFLILLNFFKFKNILKINKDNFYNFSLLLITSLIIFIQISNNLTLGWDVQKFWIYKTLNFYNGNSIDNLSNLPNSWYPYLGSLSWSFFWKVSFLNNEYAGRLFYIFVYLCSILMLINSLKLSYFYKSIFFISIIIISYDYSYHSHWSMFSGYQEILIFSLLTISIHFLFRLVQKEKKTENIDLFSILLISNLLIWIKHEGFVISISIIFTLILFSHLSNKKKVITLLSYLFILFFRFFIFDYYDLNSSNILHVGYQELNFDNFFQKLSPDRFFIILKFLVLNLLSNYLILVGILLLVILIIKGKKLQYLNYFFFLIFFNISIFIFIYALTDLDLSFMLKTGMDRVIYQLSPFIFLIFLESFKLKKN